MAQERDPETVAFEHAVRRAAIIHRIEAIRRISTLRGSARTWWAVREMLRNRTEGKR